eukprot:gene10225-22981_t
MLYSLPNAPNYQACEAIAQSNHQRCAFNPTVVNYAASTNQCQCAVPSTTPCRRKVYSSTFSVYVLAGNTMSNGHARTSAYGRQSLIGVIGDPRK